MHIIFYIICIEYAMTVENNIITDPFMRNFIIKLYPVKNKQAGRDTFER